ncbi:isochorismate synthase [Actinomadura sp. KC216]|uniref:isochorismate synthase n=1 Tax=Actinomadura sp. KC216 TaxID=2530370 RepID=UPI00104FD655|nr:isochorismate synthase [Actinomadura sp. KC216]TDB76011.1 isochorismate synthase [Actinomadura sp. KC216]
MTILTEPHADLLSAYLPGDSFFFRSPGHTLLARGTAATVPTCNSGHPAATLARRVRETLAEARAAGQPRPIVVGALPFDTTTPARLTVPATVHWTGPTWTQEPPDEPPVAFGTVRQTPSPETYKQSVAKALDQLEEGALEKVVLARAFDLDDVVRADVPAMLHRLAHGNPAGYVFAVDLLRGRTLLGASPELLVQRSGGLVTANPLAGSAPRHPDPDADARAGEALLASAKDLYEHSMVVDAVAAGLRQFCGDLEVPHRPALSRTPTMWHLSTRIQGRLLDPDVASIHLAAALHPTPAVCGTPQELARGAIQRLEPFNRGFYSGAVGWTDSSGDGEWAIALRCAEVAPHEIRAYAGAGIVTGSDPEAELAETTAKFRTFLRALGIERDL